MLVIIIVIITGGDIWRVNVNDGAIWRKAWLLPWGLFLCAVGNGTSA